jgi:hypothetical protein
MGSVSDELDQLTHTFTIDRTYCDALFHSKGASLTAELLLSHLWSNSALPLCHHALAAQIQERFGARYSEEAALWNLVLFDSASRDLRLIPYFVLRGLGPEASVALRRAFEHVGVLAHVWARPEKVELLSSSDREKYKRAFIWDGKPIRFAALKMPEVAYSLYSSLSELDIHGGTGARYFSYATEPSSIKCNFTHRIEPESEHMQQQLTLLANGHRSVNAELVGICADYAPPSDELEAVARTLKMFLTPAGGPSAELQARAKDLCRQLGLQIG